jgi:hypothetical protein
VDVPANPSLGKRFNIKGFPSLLLISKGMVYEYPAGKDWPRDRESLAKFASGGLFREVVTDDAKPCPPPPDFLADLKKAALQGADALVFYAKDPTAIQDPEWGFLLAGFVGGIICSSLLSFLVRAIIGGPTPEEERAKAKKDA